MKKLLFIVACFLAINSGFSQDKSILVYVNYDKFNDVNSIKFIKNLERCFKETKVKSKRIYEYRHVLNTENDSTIINKHLLNYKPNLLWKFTLTYMKTTPKSYLSYSPISLLFGLHNSSFPSILMLRQNTFYEYQFRIEIELTDLDKLKVIDRNVITDEYYTGYFNELKYNKVIE